MADPQKHRLYAAEQSVGSVGIRHFRSLDDIRAFVDKVVNSEWWREHSRVRKVDVFLARKDSHTAKAYPALAAWRGEVQMNPFITLPPTWAATDFTIIHELAHAGWSDTEAHGPEYAARYIEMTRRFVGALVARDLQRAFDVNAVEYSGGKSVGTGTARASARATRDMMSENDREFLRLIGM